MNQKRLDRAAAIGLSAALFALAALSVRADDRQLNQRPAFIKGDISIIQYDGVDDDLLTGGLGRSGLALPAPPAFSDPLAPTAAELRTRAIYSNYRALVDTAAGGGYGVFYGPNVSAEGDETAGEGKIAGDEAIAFADNGSGRFNVTLMVQVPYTFSPNMACIVTAPSSGSRGVYGAIGTAGEWGLKNGCAVAYTDKGTGTGAHNLSDDTVGLIDGTRADADAAGKSSTFTASINDRVRSAFNADSPHRWAFKHAHSQINPEKDWGHNVLQSIEFAFFILNQEFGDPLPNGGIRKTLVPSNTIVIASSVSNGGGSSVRAAEQDGKGLIDGVAVSEPNVNPEFDSSFAIVQGDGEPFFDHSRSLYDYTTLLNVYQSCASADPAAIADDLGLPPFNFAPSAAACQSLFDLGLLTATELTGRAAEAQAIINDYGFLSEQNVLMPSHWFLNVPQAIAVTYANSYGRSSVVDNLCGYSFAATNAGVPDALPKTSEAALFGASNGIPPTGSVNLINNVASGGAKENRTSTPDQNLDGALCLRSLATGRQASTGTVLNGRAQALHRRIGHGIAEVRASGNLRGKPAIFVTGRSDAILPPNHTSRAYFGLNRLREGSASGLRYIEVLNAQHLDVLNGFPGFMERYIPLHHYFNQALDLMLAHLRDGAPLPPSQVVRAKRRGFLPDGVTVPNLDSGNLPDIAFAPDEDERITFVNGEVRIPE